MRFCLLFVKCYNVAHLTALAALRTSHTVYLTLQEFSSDPAGSEIYIFSELLGVIDLCMACQ